MDLEVYLTRLYRSGRPVPEYLILRAASPQNRGEKVGAEPLDRGSGQSPEKREE